MPHAPLERHSRASLQTHITSIIQSVIHCLACALDKQVRSQALTAGGGHNARIFHFGKSKVANHNFGIFIGTVVEQIFGLAENKHELSGWGEAISAHLEVAMHHAAAVHVVDGLQNLFD